MTASSGTRCWPLVAVVSGLVVCWLLIGIQQYVWDGGINRRLPYLPDSWYATYEAVYNRLGVPRQLSSYYFWGRFALLIYVAVFIGVWALPRGVRRVTRAGRGVLLTAVVAGLIGDVLGYWGGRGEELSTLTGIGFGLVELPALLVMIIAMVTYGVGLVRDACKPAVVGWSLVAGGMLSVPVSIFVLTYIPHGVLLTIMGALTVALAGACLAGRAGPSVRS